MCAPKAPFSGRCSAALVAALALFVSLDPSLAVAATSFIPLQKGGVADLGGRFRYAVDPVGPGETVETTLFLLDRKGNVWSEVPLQEGDVIQVHLRDERDVRPMSNQVRWLIRSPGLLARATVRSDFQREVWYASPFAAVRIDQPDPLVFSARHARHPIAAHVTIGIAHVDLATLGLSLDCVDILTPVAGPLPGGPYSGTVSIDGYPIEIRNLVADPVRGTLSLTIVGLPGGGHRLTVRAAPDYAADLPPGSSNWKRPLGSLENAATVAVFRVEIDHPSAAESLSGSTVVVSGTLTHGLLIRSARVHGRGLALPEPTIKPPDACHGSTFQVPFQVELPVANLERDIVSGDDEVSSFDPGVNFVSVIAADTTGATAGDRARFMLGETAPGFARVAGPQLRNAPAAVACSPTPKLPDHVTNGFAASLSERAIDQVVRTVVLPKACAAITQELVRVEGRKLSAIFDPCSYPRESNPNPPPCPGRPDPVPGLNSGRHAPVLVAVRDTAIAKLDSLRIVLVATDQDGDRVHLSMKEPLDNALVCDSLFLFGPGCDQVGTHVVTFIATDGVASVERTATIQVRDRDLEFPIDLTVGRVEVHPERMKLETRIADDRDVVLTFRTGPLLFPLRGGECWFDTYIFGCAVGWHVKADLALEDMVVTYRVPAQEFICGTKSPVAPESVDIDGLEARNVDAGIDGWLAWAGPQALLTWTLNQGATEIAQAVADLLLPMFTDDIGGIVVGVLPGVAPIPGLPDLSWSGSLGGIPLQLDEQPSNVPVLHRRASMTMGLHTSFTPITPVGPIPEWSPTPSEVPGAEALNADLLLQVSDDAVNQMLSGLTSTGLLRGRIERITLGDAVGTVTPEQQRWFDLLGVDATTPLTLAVDNAQDDAGNAVPPFLILVDDAVTADRIEFVARAQLLARGILPRDGSILDDRDLCACWDIRPECRTGPCLLFENLLRLNFLAHARLVSTAGEYGVRIAVDEVQQVVRRSGFDAFEASDFTAQEDSIVATSHDSGLLEAFREKLNANLPLLKVPVSVLTLRGTLSDPVNVRLRSVRVSGAGHGTEDYFGIAADIVPQTIACAPLPPSAAAGETANVTGFGAGPAAAGNRAGAPSSQPSGTGAPPSRPLWLSAGHPNPFAGSIHFGLQLDRSSSVRVTVYDVQGREIALLKEGTLGPGAHSIRWDGKDRNGNHAAAGIYFMAIRTDKEIAYRRIAHLR